MPTDHRNLCTVRIWNAETNVPVGTGFLVDFEHVMTCAHVVNLAIGDADRPQADKLIQFDFPGIVEDWRPKPLQARVVASAWRPRHSAYPDDVAVLEVLFPETLPREARPVWMAKDVRPGDKFTAFGFKQGWPDGTFIAGEVTGLLRPGRLEVITFEDDQRFGEGLSGSAAWNSGESSIIGMIVEEQASRQGRLVPASDLAKVWSILPEPAIKDPWKGFEGASPDIRFVPRRSYAARLSEALLHKRYPFVLVWARAGQGKTEIARHWIEDIKTHEPAYFDGVLYYTLDRPDSFESLVSSAANWLGWDNSGRSSSFRLKVHFVLDILTRRRVLLVIDNFERLLAPANPDRYDFVDPSVHGFLREFQQAAGLSSILALSRVAIDSLELDQGAIINLGALERSEVLAMLQAYGLEGTDEELGAGKSLFDWHPLLLRVAVRYASAKEMALDRLFVGDLPHEARPGSGLNELLDRYDELLRPNAVQLLCLLTQCRPQSSKAFIRPMLEKCGVSPAALLLPSPDEAASVVEQLRRLQLVQLVGSYISVHPSVREYYRQRFQKLPSPVRASIHRAVAAAYAASARKAASLEHPDLDALQVFVEQVHHLCEAGAAGHRPSFMEAFKVMRRDIDRGDEYVLTGGLGAWETRREMLSGFFIGRDFLYSAHDGVQRSAKSLMLNEAGQCLTHVGRYDDAARVLAKKIEMDGDRQKWGLAAVGCRNLSDTFAIRGRLREACEWMEKSRRFASLDEEARGTLEHVVSAKYGLGYLLSMLGDARGESEFEEAAALRKKLEPQQGRIDPRGVREIRHAEHLVVHGRPEEARALIDDQVAQMGRLRRDADQALSLRVRGDCLHLLGEPSRRSFERAVLLAKQCDETFIKAECELAYIRYLIWKLSPMQEAEVSLRSVRRTCQDYRFELLLVQSYIVEACLQTQHGKLDAAKCAFDRAIDLADPLGYRWPLRLWEVWRGSSRL